MGQLFGIHHTLGNYDKDTGKVTLPAKSTLYKWRIVMLFCYLNTVQHGGEMHFAAANDIHIKPVMGRAILFQMSLAPEIPNQEQFMLENVWRREPSMGSTFGIWTN